MIREVTRRCSSVCAIIKALNALAEILSIIVIFIIIAQFEFVGKRTVQWSLWIQLTGPTIEVESLIKWIAIVFDDIENIEIGFKRRFIFQQTLQRVRWLSACLKSQIRKPVVMPVQRINSPNFKFQWKAKVKEFESVPNYMAIYGR